MIDLTHEQEAETRSPIRPESTIPPLSIFQPQPIILAPDTQTSFLDFLDFPSSQGGDSDSDIVIPETQFESPRPEVEADDAIPVIEPPPRIPAKYKALQDRTPFGSFDDLAQFTADHAELTAGLLDALDHPFAADHQMARYWLAHVRKVTPDDLTKVSKITDETLLTVTGKALNLSETSRTGMLAELYWTKPRAVRTRDLAEVQSDLRKAGLASDFDQRRAAFQARQRLPDPEPATIASMKYGRWGTLKDKAAAWLKTAVPARQSELGTEHETTEKWLGDLRAKPELSDDRSLDRLADVMTLLNANRVCAAVLHNGREIGVFANKPDNQLAVDLAELLTASRATGKEAENLVWGILAKMTWRASRSSRSAPESSKRRDQVRILKAISYLRKLEQEHGRLRVVAYDDPLPTLAVTEKDSFGHPQLVHREQQVHAEMQATSIALRYPGAKLGIGRLCCFKCWLVLHDLWPEAFDNRPVASHLNTYPWPPPGFFADAQALAQLFAGWEDPPEDLRAALQDPQGRAALVNAFFAVQGIKGALDTGFPSTQVPASQLPSTPAWPEQEDGPTAEEAEREAELYDGLLYPDKDVTRTETSPTDQRSAPRRPSEPTITKAPLTKVKRTQQPDLASGDSDRTSPSRGRTASLPSHSTTRTSPTDSGTTDSDMDLDRPRQQSTTTTSKKRTKSPVRKKLRV
ncbi:hypothetical protein [Acrocarpospora corrugata]|uniref:hypothetical protein n=1 Tax=Acrocarpospora corrugata TaxID=35763 RepID=UPI0012D3502A|nr:hypothetical protein [Acrocarpospora corrugata]